MTELYTIPEIETNQLDFIPLSICENIAGNYDNYLRTTISHILKIKKLEKKNSDKDYFFPNKEFYINNIRARVQRNFYSGRFVLRD